MNLQLEQRALLRILVTKTKVCDKKHLMLAFAQKFNYERQSKNYPRDLLGLPGM